MVGVGILIRDEGSLVGACSKKIMAPLGAIEAEERPSRLDYSLLKICLSRILSLKVIR